MTRYDSVTLASASPRRSALLTQIGVRHQIRPAEIDETLLPGEAPDRYVTRIATAKAEAGWRADARQPVLAADTSVVLGAELFGKPADLNDCVRMLGALGGRSHRVLTAVAVRDAAGMASALSVSEVAMRTLSLEERRRYWQSGEPAGKAGSYAIQGLAATFITHLTGSYSGVMGLPLAETAALLENAGVCLWSSAEPA